MPFEESFLLLPFLLHRATREDLPRSTRTSLAVWLEEKPLARGRIAARARLLVPITKEALLFGGVHGLIHLDGGRLRAEGAWRRELDPVLLETTDEVKECVARASFVGKWFGEAGSGATVLALVGVRP